MNLSELRQIIHNSLWKNNPALVQLLGLCPLLAMTTSAVNGFALGLATALVMALSNGAISAVRHMVPHEIRIPVFILIIAALVTVLQLLMHAHMPSLYAVLGIFIPLITTNCIVLARAEAYAAKNKVLPSIFDGFFMGLGGALVLAVMGGVREILGRGTLFYGIDLVFGPPAKAWVLHLMPADYPGFLLAILPPGAFFTLALLIAGRNAWVSHLEQKQKRQAQQAPRLDGLSAGEVQSV